MTSRDFSLTSLIPGVFLPTIIFEIGLGAILPVIALTGLHLGASVAGAGLLVSMLAIGQILGDVPAGALAARDVLLTLQGPGLALVGAGDNVREAFAGAADTAAGRG